MQQRELFLISNFKLLAYINLFIISSVILSSSAPRVFAEQSLYNCYSVSPVANSFSLCGSGTPRLPEICIVESDPISLTNYFSTAPRVFTFSDAVYPISTTYSEVLTSSSTPVFPTQTKEYNSPLTITNTQPATTGSLSNGGSQLVFTGNNTFGNDSFDYTISDQSGNSDTGSVYFKISNSADSYVERFAIPYAINTFKNQQERVYFAFGLSSLPVTIVSQPSNGILDTGNNQIYYNPNNNFSGTDSFTYRINDPRSGTFSSIQTVYVKVIDPAAKKIIATNESLLRDIQQSDFFSIGSNSYYSGIGYNYFLDIVDGTKTESHTYSALAPSVTSQEQFKSIDLKFDSLSTTDNIQLSPAPRAIPQSSLIQPLRIEHKNTSPILSNVRSDFYNTNATLFADINDLETNDIDVIFELSRDNFSTISDTFTIANQPNGAVSHTFTNLALSPYTYRVRALENDSTLPNTCLSFTNSSPQVANRVQTSAFPIRKSSGEIYGITTILPTNNGNATTVTNTLETSGSGGFIQTGPVGLIRTGGTDIN